MQIEHLTKKRPGTTVETLRFEVGLRKYPAQTNFKAPQPWVFNPNEAPLKEIVPITQELLEKGGYEQNVHYSSVVRIDPKRDLRGKHADHLALPKWSDKFIAGQDPKLVRELCKGKNISLNQIKW